VCASIARVTLKSGRDKSVRQRHPRLFASAIKEIDGKNSEASIGDSLKYLSEEK
jgi:hypothetical protein